MASDHMQRIRKLSNRSLDSLRSEKITVLSTGAKFIGIFSDINIGTNDHRNDSHFKNSTMRSSQPVIKVTNEQYELSGLKGVVGNDLTIQIGDDVWVKYDDRATENDSYLVYIRKA